MEEENVLNNGALTNTGTEVENNEATSKKVQRKIGPTNDHDLMAVIKSLLSKWDENEIKIIWMSKMRLNEKYDYFVDLLYNRTTVGATRGSITGDLKILGKEIDVSIEYVKGRLAERLGSKKKAIECYREIGVVKEQSYKLPRSKEMRANSFDVLINGLKTYQLEDITYGVDYWTDIRNRYVNLLGLARNTDGSVSFKVGTLNEERKELKQFFNSFILIIRANYPNTWQSVLRDYGFQKEKY